MNKATKDAILASNNQKCSILLCSVSDKPFSLIGSLENFAKTVQPENFFLVFSFSPGFMLKYSFKKPDDRNSYFEPYTANPYVEPSELTEQQVINLGKYKLTPPEIYKVISKKHSFTSEECFRSRDFPESLKEFGLNTTMNLNLNSINYTEAFKNDNVNYRVFLTHYENSTLVSGAQTARQLLEKTDAQKWWVCFRYENGITHSFKIVKGSRFKWTKDDHKFGDTNTVMYSDLGYENVCLGEYNFDPDFIWHFFKMGMRPYLSNNQAEVAREFFISTLSGIQINLDQPLLVKQYQDSGS